MAQIIGGWIKRGVFNFKTGEPFKLEDIKDLIIRAEVEAILLRENIY
ncbi:MAG: hypothetical protein ACOWWO_12130 [Peptococcaceae bacterium]